MPLIFSNCSNEEKELELQNKINSLTQELDECENGSEKILAKIKIANNNNNNCRLVVLQALSIVIRNGMLILGVSTPSSM